MEVSKALTKTVKKIIKKDYKIIDIGYICRHYWLLKKN